MRFLANGPRSVTVTATDLPVSASVTLALVPRGRVRLAAVICRGANAAPLAVFFPASLRA